MNHNGCILLVNKNQNVFYKNNYKSWYLSVSDLKEIGKTKIPLMYQNGDGKTFSFYGQYTAVKEEDKNTIELWNNENETFKIYEF